MIRRSMKCFWTNAVLLLGLWSAGPTVASPYLDYNAIFNLETAMSPVLSPQGDRIVYVRRFGDVLTDRFYSNLWSVDFDGRNHRQLTSGKFQDSEPLWTPDGRRLLFKSNREGGTQVYQLDIAGGALKKLTSGDASPSDLSISPDGKWLCYVAFVPSAPTVLAAVAPPAGASWAPPPRTVDRMIYRYDGIGYLPNGYFQLFLLPIDGGESRQLTRGKVHHALFYHAAQDSKRTPPVWTPDGRYLLFVANLKESYEHEVREFEIHRVSVATGEVETLTRRKGPDFEPAISPDGTRIAYVGFDDEAKPHQNSRLYVMGTDGSGSRLVSGHFPQSIEEPRWDRDGRGLVFAYVEQGRGKLGYMDLQGRVTEIAEDVGMPGSDAAVTYDLAANGRFVYPYAVANQAGNLAVGEIRKKKKVKLVTDLNMEALSHTKLSHKEEFWYDSSDGRKIHSWIMQPPDFDPKRKYPLIVFLHGGPAQAYSDRFDSRKEIMAAQGYVLLFMNYRGSTSYGEDFANLIYDRFPGAAYEDVIAGVDAVARQPYIDSSNMFLFGGSAGGQLVLWIVGKTDRFRAAVSLFPVSNRYSAMLTVDRPGLDLGYRYKQAPWERPRYYVSDVSPLSLVGDVTTPVLLMAGENDFRVRMTEAEQYYMALKIQKKEAMFMIFPNESHGIGRSPSHQYSLLVSSMKWFEQHRTSQGSEGGTTQ